MVTEREYKIAEGFNKIGEAHEALFREGYCWLANAPESEAIARVVSLREMGYEVKTCRPTFRASGEIAVGEAAVLVKK